MEDRRKLRQIRVLSAGTVAALYIVLYFFTNIHYDLSDDAVLLRSFAGSVGGVYEPFNIYTHTLLSWLLHGLSLLMPSVAWFSVTQVLLLTSASYIILNSIQRIALRLNRPFPVGWLIAVLFLGCMALEFLTSVTYTTTTAVLGAASVWKLLSVDWDQPRARVVSGVVSSFIWLLFAYMLRQISALPNLCFWLGACLCEGLFFQTRAPQSRQKWRRLALSAGVCLLLLAVMAGVRWLDIRQSSEKEYLNWQTARIASVDYGGISNAESGALQAIGWPESERTLALNWYFLDQNMTTEAFQSLAAHHNTTSLPDAVGLILRLFRHNRNTGYYALFFLFFCGVALLSAFLAKTQNRWHWIAPLGCAAVTGAALLYLALKSRLPVRAAVSVLLPACSLSMWLMLHNLAQLRLRRPACRWPAVLSCLVACALALGSLNTVRANVYNPASARTPASPSRFALLDGYAREHPELIFIAENAFGMDTELFPRYIGPEQATNILYLWGSWNDRSSGFRALFKQHGLQYDQFSAANLLCDPVRVVVLGNDPPAILLDYIREKLGRDAYATVEYQTDGFSVLSLHESPVD